MKHDETKRDGHVKNCSPAGGFVPNSVDQDQK